jgi:L-alanine-DL-glutamate epimerase-like enolase superfamily enzyme
MRVARVEAVVEHLKPARAADAYAGRESLTFLRLAVTTEDGTIGQGLTGRFLAEKVAALLNEEIGQAVASQDALAHEAIRARLVARFNPRGLTGAFVSALSALDLALWDLKGKLLGQPVARLLGGARDAVPSYATAGLPAFTEAELLAACKAALDQGFRGVKVLVATGRPLAEEATRIRAVRRAIGEAPLMLDANCGYSVAEAKRLAQLVADCDIAFFEEPVKDNDIPSLVALRHAIPIPLAAGQMVQSPSWFRDALAAGALDIVQPNAAFCGGLTSLLRILALAEAHGVPATGAGGFEAANLPAMAGHPHGGMLEVHGAHAALRERFATHPRFADGSLVVPEAPGLGFALAA